MRRTFIIFLLSIIFYSCSEKSQLETISFQNAFLEGQRIAIQDFVHDVKLCPLQTSSNCLLGDIQKIIKSEKYYFILDMENILYMFSSEGSFVRRIGEKGNDPKEYSYISDFAINDDNKQIYLNTNRNILIYDFKGIFIKEINNYGAGQLISFDDKIIISMPDIPTEQNEKDAILVVNQDGDIEKSFKTNLVRHSGIDLEFSILYKSNNNVYYKEERNDTIFSINHSFEKNQDKILQMGKYQMPDEEFDFDKMDAWEKYYRFVEIFDFNPFTIYEVQNGPIGEVGYIFRNNKNEKLIRISQDDELELFMDDQFSIPIIPVSSYNNHLICSVSPFFLKELYAYLNVELGEGEITSSGNDNPVLLDIEIS